MTMQKGSNTQTTKTSYPQYIEDAQKTYFNELGNYFGQGLENGGAPLAELTPAQQQAFYLQERMLDKPVDNYADEIMAAGQGVTGEDITSLMNPYLETVGRSTLDAMGRERANEDARIGARNASSVAFGGSGPALERAQLNRGYGENVASTIGNLMSQGYDRASALAQANANMGLSAATQAGQATSDAFQRQRQAINDRLQGGTLEQEYRQRQADRPWDLLQQYGSILPSPSATQTTSSPREFSPLQTLLGVGLTVGGMPTAGGGSLMGSWLS